MASVPPRFHRAAASGDNLKVKQYLPTAGDDVNCRDADGRTVICYAVDGNHINTVTLLLAAGADPSICDNGEFFPLYLAAQTGNIAIARALIKANADIDAIIERPDSGTALSVAAFLGDKAMVKLLLDAGCDTSKVAAGGRHPLAVASVKGRIDVVRILLDAGADVNAVACGTDGVSALMAGAQIGSCDVVRKLLEGGADVNQTTPTGRTALHMAAQEGFDEVINILIAAGAAVDPMDCNKSTPLRTAAFHGHHQCAYALLRAGANVATRNIHGSSLLHVAAEKGFTDVIEVLLSGGAIADVNFEDNLNRTPLITASAFADVKAVALLLDAGADINQQDATGNTALFGVSDLKIVKVLLDRGADARLTNNYGSTLLHIAGFCGACAGVLCALFKAGADPTVKNRAGKTAADVARGEGHEDAAKLLDLLAAKHRSMNGA